MKQLAFAIAAVGVAACTQRYSVDDYWDELGTVHCQRMRDCCTTADYDDWWDGNDQACLAAWRAPTDAAQIRDGLTHDRIHFDEVGAHACVEALRDQACGEFEQAYRYRESYCTPPLHGDLAPGDHCQLDEECASHTCATGVCIVPVAAGAVCQPAEVCEGPYECSGTCTLGNPEGIACSVDADCIDSWCKTDIFNNGTCKRACKGR